MNVMRRRLCALFLLALLALVPLGASAAFADGEPDNNQNNAGNVGNTNDQNLNDNTGTDGDAKAYETKAGGTGGDAKAGGTEGGTGGDTGGGTEGRTKADGTDGGTEAGGTDGGTGADGTDNGAKADGTDGGTKAGGTEGGTGEAKAGGTEGGTGEAKAGGEAGETKTDGETGETKTGGETGETKADSETKNAITIKASEITKNPAYNKETNQFSPTGDITIYLDKEFVLDFDIYAPDCKLTFEGKQSLIVRGKVTAREIVLGAKDNTKPVSSNNQVDLTYPANYKFAKTNDGKSVTVVDADNKDEQAKLVAFNTDVFTVKFEPASLNIEDQQVLKDEKAQVPSNTPKSECDSSGSGWYSGNTKLENLPITADTTFTWKPHNLKHYLGKEPTCDEDGYKECWECIACGTYFADETCKVSYGKGNDAKKAILLPGGHKWSDWAVTNRATTKAAGKEERSCERCEKIETRSFEYTFSKGASDTWTKGGSSDLEIVVKRNHDDEKTHGLFVEVLVDDKTVDSKNYTTESGSLKLKLKKSYLDTLSEKEHSVEIKFEDGSAKTKLTVKPAPAKTSAAKSPSTGETIPAGVIIAIVVVAVVAVAAIIIARRRMA